MNESKAMPFIRIVFLRVFSVFFVLCVVHLSLAADVESRILTTYIPQDTLETVVRTEGWTEFPLAVKGGVRKGDTVRIWAGGSIDRGNGDQPGQNVGGPQGLTIEGSAPTLALSQQPGHTYALLFKAEEAGLHRCLPAGKPLEIKLAKDQEKLFLGFNDEKGRYGDNHIGKGRRHELDPLWVRVEVVRTVVD
ncbi:MAG: hypothetical protein K2R98_26950 [Gemmataceae bacterium]|nr:hypothetical protein [Gemmataceae bacterium]